MLVESQRRLDLLQLILGLKAVSKASENDEAPRLRPQANAFSDLMNMQYAQAASILPRPLQKPRPPVTPSSKREQPERERRNGEHEPGQRRSAWA